MKTYRIRPNYRTCSYKSTVKQLSSLDYSQYICTCTFIYFFIKKKKNNIMLRELIWIASNSNKYQQYSITLMAPTWMACLLWMI